jgi:hypothetical protein
VDHFDGVEPCEGGNDDRLVELASDFLLAVGVGTLWNEFQGRGPLVSIIGVMAYRVDRQ